MAFKFIHSADWQLGKPFGSFDRDSQTLLRRARLEAIDRLADIAGKAAAHHILVAGDVYDGDVDERILLPPLDKMAAHSEIFWHLLPGNHDPAPVGGIWQRVRAAQPAENIIIHDQAVPHEVEPGVFILPAPLRGTTHSTDPSEWMDSAATPDGAIRIGLAHGSVHGFDSAGEAAVELSPTRDQTAGLSYLALGDWHGLTRISPRVWYSGTPEPDRFKDNRSGHVLVVHLENATAPPQVEEVASAAFFWHRRAMRIAAADDLAPLEAETEGWGVARSASLLQLELSGGVSLDDYAQIEERLARLAPGLFHLELRLEDLHALAVDDDLDMIGTGAVRAAAKRLQAIATNKEDARAPIAELALRRLYVLAREVAGETERHS